MHAPSTAIASPRRGPLERFPRKTAAAERETPHTGQSPNHRRTRHGEGSWASRSGPIDPTRFYLGYTGLGVAKLLTLSAIPAGIARGWPVVRRSS